MSGVLLFLSAFRAPEVEMVEALTSVLALGLLLHRRLSQVAENTLKFAVGFRSGGQEVRA